MSVKVEIFSQGEEIITGQTVDSNAAWLSQQLVQMGFSITRHSTVGDKLDDLTALLQEIAARADCCICTGGLGPTVDDLTAEAVAQAFALPLKFDEMAYQQITHFFSRRNRHMPESNRKQAMLPHSALRLDNEWGTAPGFALYYSGCWFAFVPGVPFEMRHLFKEKIKPLLEQQFSLVPGKLVTIKTVGLGESDIQERLEGIKLPQDVRLGFRTGMDEIQTKLFFPPGVSETTMQKSAAEIADRIGDAVFAIDGLSGQAHNLVSVVAAELAQKQQSLVVIETISHGLLAAKCMSHQCLQEAMYAASVERLYSKLGLQYRHEDHSAAAVKLAEAIRDQSGADLALVQLGDNNDQLLKDKDQAITLCNVLATRNGIQHSSVQVVGPIKRKQNQAALLALDFLRRSLQKQDQ